MNATDENMVPDRADLWTIQRILVWSAQYLKDKCPDSNASNFRLEAEMLLAHALSLPRIHLYMHLEKPLSVSERNLFKDLLKRRISGEPVPYILERKEFYGLDFKVTKDTLIPRPDTEVLVNAALETLKSNKSGDRRKVLDIGTGSGCIAISIALNHDLADVEAWDVSADALSIAVENSKKLSCETISFVHRDGLASESWERSDKFDLIVSNPPYLATHEAKDLSPSVVKFEPNQALFSGESGLEFYEMIARFGKKILMAGGKCILEIGYQQKSDVEKVFVSCGWELVQTCKDLAGIERVMVFR